MNSEPDASGREQRFQDVLAAYLQAVEAEQNPDRDAWLAKYPDVAVELRSFFANQDDFARLAEPLSVAPPSEPATVGLSANGASAPEAGERVRYFGDYELLEKIAAGVAAGNATGQIHVFKSAVRVTFESRLSPSSFSALGSRITFRPV